jgi:nitroimidazol reductase NimA-like FMN-containing flavoprotein (pyridoxamine 5'-phosphate oxidase superfamily)/DNA-binding XRE family transcriptional regulator
MPVEQPPRRSGPPSERVRGDMGRRIAARRRERGLSRRELAERAGAAPGYIRYLEEHTASPGTGFLLQIADALDTTIDELTGRTADRPPGLGRAGRHPHLVSLSSAECRGLLGTHGVGRVAVDTRSGPAILPVNYVVADGELAFRTSPGAQPARAAGHRTAFEVDHIDEALSEGWSVLAVGPARAVTDDAEARRLRECAYTTPWAGGARNYWVVLTPRRLTGSRIVVGTGSAPA